MCYCYLFSNQKRQWRFLPTAIGRFFFPIQSVLSTFRDFHCQGTSQHSSFCASSSQATSRSPSLPACECTLSSSLLSSSLASCTQRKVHQRSSTLSEPRCAPKGTPTSEPSPVRTESISAQLTIVAFLLLRRLFRTQFAKDMLGFLRPHRHHYTPGPCQ